MSFCRSKRFSQATLNESFPGPAHYYVNWGSFGFFQMAFNKFPRLSDNQKPRKTEKNSPQRVKNAGQATNQMKRSASDIQRSQCTRLSLRKSKDEADRKKKFMEGESPKPVANRIPVFQRNSNIRLSLRNPNEKYDRKGSNLPIFQRSNKDKNQLPKKKPSDKPIIDDSFDQNTSEDPNSLYHVLKVRTEYLRENSTKDILSGFYENKNNNSDDETTEPSLTLTEKEFEMFITNDIATLDDDYNKENVPQVHIKITEKKLECIQVSDTDDEEVQELLEMSNRETDFSKKMDILQRVSDLQRKEYEKTICNLSEIVEEGNALFSKTM